MKTLKLTTLVLVTAVCHSALAEDSDLCAKDGYTVNSTQCKTAAGGVAVAAPSGIYSLTKYSQANALEREYDKRVYGIANDKAPQTASDITRVSGSFTDGDRITINYRLSDEANRAYHIHKMEADAAAARSRASYDLMMSVTATKAKYNTVSDGKGGTTQQYAGQEPDFASRAMYAGMAIHEQGVASSDDQAAADARAGKPVPIYNFDKVVDSEKGTVQAVNSIAKDELLSKGSIIRSISRFPVEKFTIYKGAVSAGRVGLAGVAIGAAVTAEELTEGAVANKILRTDYSPDINDGYPTRDDANR